ncbi:MAG TPA: lipoate--protein ligase family protein [Longimicrobium sp.]|jgi:lipoate-protein ligase A|uniref:lipoate--protein ligase family protein n=1 Tax=Longimicrobium sp. TaxID=2029185 RepID=UPI002EDB8719
MQNTTKPRPAWRLLDTAPAPGAWNMAVDEALADAVRGGGPPVLRIYRWDPACLSLGRNQPSDGYDRHEIARRGLDVVRRPTGGRAVLHARELTYSVAMCDNVLGTPRQAYAAINRALVAGLRRLGVDARLQPQSGERAPLPSLAPCFEQPVEGEVVAGGSKLVGSAQRRERGVILQHGSLPLHDDQSLLAELMRPGVPVPPAAPPATLAALLGTVPAWAELAAALAKGWREAVGGDLREDTLSAAERAGAEVHRARYEDPAWTWHR